MMGGVIQSGRRRPRRAARPLAVALLAACAAAPLRAAENPRAALRQGLDAHRAGRPAEAAAAFARAATNAPAAGLDPALARFDEGTALIEAGRFDEGRDALRQAQGTADRDLQSAARYNLGGGLVRRADERLAQGELQPAKEALEGAVQAFADAITLDSRDRDAKINYELARRRLENLVEQMKRSPPSEPPPDEGQKPPENEEPRPDEKRDGEEPPSPTPSPDGAKAEPTPGPPPQGEPREPQQMTKDEALLLLEALKEEESADRRELRLKLGEPVPVLKDW
jgi:tetratricopeptide (TPR) repeat protein